MSIGWCSDMMMNCGMRWGLTISSMARQDVSTKKLISAFTLDIEEDTWEGSRGFTKRMVEMPHFDEKRNAQDAVSVLIRMRFAGVCGTDRGIWHREVFKDLIHASLQQEKKTRRVLGHEFVGTVVRVGSQVENLYGIRTGDEVSGDSHITCGRCFQCRIGEEEVCQDQAILGVSIDGVFAEYIKIPAKNLWAVDFDRVRPEIASMFDPFGNAVHACSKVDLRGKRIAVLGCGPIGLFTILLARAFGAVKIIAADVEEKNLLMAERLGAHYTVNIKHKEDGPGISVSPALRDAVVQRTYGKGVDVVFEMAGPNRSVVNALDIARGGGDSVRIKGRRFLNPRVQPCDYKRINALWRNRTADFRDVAN
jgi:threonine 3-dehydrogenase